MTIREALSATPRTRRGYPKYLYGQGGWRSLRKAINAAVDDRGIDAGTAIAQLAAHCHITPRAVKGYINGQRTPRDLYLLVRMCQWLKVSEKALREDGPLPKVFENIPDTT